MDNIQTAIAYFDKKGLKKIESWDFISWSNEYVEYYLDLLDNSIKCYSIELSSHLVFLFYLHEDPKVFLETMQKYDIG